jgi:hypothetical protein
MPSQANRSISNREGQHRKEKKREKATRAEKPDTTTKEGGKGCLAMRNGFGSHRER